MQACAILSVSDKRGIVDLATALADAGCRLLSTGGTAAVLRDAGLSVTDVSEHTGLAEMMSGRVKTLHPTVHGGILGRRGTDDDIMRELHIAPIDYVVVNLYPFEQTVARADVTPDEAIENIDIGGPAMVRSAAKNHASVTVVTDPDDYPKVIDSLQAGEPERCQLRQRMAVKAFAHTAHYDGMIANFLGSRMGGEDGTHSFASPAPYPPSLSLQFQLRQNLRYGENPHQNAAFYTHSGASEGTVGGAELLQGKAMSYNNVMDADAALACVAEFTESPACVIVKHANPCGVATSSGLSEAYDLAYQTDPTSAFGGIIAFNQPLDADTAAMIIERQFVEVIVAPGVSKAALDCLSSKPGVRVLNCSQMPAAHGTATMAMRPISGGMLVQDEDRHQLTQQDLTVVSERAPSEQELADLLFSWRVAKYVKSNAIVYGRHQSTVGIGAGQMSRVYSARIAGIKAQDAGLDVAGAVMASDAFFPFRDGIDNAAAVGICAVIQPGGSRNDAEVIAAANEHGMAMVFTGVRHFRH